MIRSLLAMTAGQVTSGFSATSGGLADPMSNRDDVLEVAAVTKSEQGRGMRGGNEAQRPLREVPPVRILRPPTESGSATLKLEKTPSLNNESVIKLVEAGFSEGTIIKRIEESPAEFDLSAPRLEELRRRRVTEAIIAAMTVAMGEDSTPGASGPAKTKGN